MCIVSHTHTHTLPCFPLSCDIRTHTMYTQCDTVTHEISLYYSSADALIQEYFVGYTFLQSGSLLLRLSSCWLGLAGAYDVTF